MKKVKSINISPEILSPINNVGYEEIFRLVQKSTITYDDDSVYTDTVSAKYFRLVDESLAGKEGVIKFTTLNTDTFNFDVKYLEPIKTNSVI